MNKFLLKLKASRNAMASLVSPADEVVSSSADGYLLLKDWAFCPEQRLLDASKVAREQQEAKHGSHALYCVEGKHKGELKLLHGSVIVVGTSFSHDLVLTPSTPGEGKVPVKLYVNGKVSIHSKSEQDLLINGRPSQRGELIDQDIVELFGNRFVYLNLRNSAISKKEEI